VALKTGKVGGRCIKGKGRGGVEGVNNCNDVRGVGNVCFKGEVDGGDCVGWLGVVRLSGRGGDAVSGEWC